MQFRETCHLNSLATYGHYAIHVYERIIVCALAGAFIERGVKAEPQGVVVTCNFRFRGFFRLPIRLLALDSCTFGIMRVIY